MRVYSFADIATADLTVDAVYQGDSAGHVGHDALARLLPVGHMGGFRYSGQPPTPRLFALVSTGSEPAWPDELAPFTGLFTYFGDNHTPGHELHDTRRQGNTIRRRRLRAPARRRSGPRRRSSTTPPDYKSGALPGPAVDRRMAALRARQE